MEPDVLLKAEVIFTNCTFTGNTNGYINHQHQDHLLNEIMALKDEEIKILKLQIEDLRQQNNKLITLLGKYMIEKSI